MDKLKNDDRFKDALTNPKYFKANKKDTKVKLGKRFERILTDKDFTLKYSVDSKGRPLKQSANEDLKKYYKCSDSEDEIEHIQSKEEAQVKSPSDDDNDEDENDEEEDDDDDDDEEESSSSSEDDDDDSKSISDTNMEDIVHTWGEMDNDTTTTEHATPRLAICNMDWDRIKAVDLFILLHSFKPAHGNILSVSIYPSEFGMERMKQEEMYGPLELKADKKEDEKHYNERMRRYQLNRLKYYYAVMVCDTIETADSIYNNCNNIEYEASATVMDLRFIPDDMDFEQPPSDFATCLPPPDHYKPSPFVTSALHQCKVNLTWDETPLERTRVLNRDLKKVSEDDNLFNQFIASASEDDDDDDDDGCSDDDKNGSDSDRSGSDNDDDNDVDADDDADGDNDDEDVSDDGGVVENSSEDENGVENDDDDCESDDDDSESDDDNVNERDMKLNLKRMKQEKDEDYEGYDNDVSGEVNKGDDDGNVDDNDEEEDDDDEEEDDDDEKESKHTIRKMVMNELKSKSSKISKSAENKVIQNIDAIKEMGDKRRDGEKKMERRKEGDEIMDEGKKKKKEGEKKRMRGDDDIEEQVLKYRALLKEINEKEEIGNDDDDVDMEVTWKTGTMQAAEGMLEEKKKKEMTSFEKYHEKRKMKRNLKKAKKLENKTNPDKSSKSDFKRKTELSESLKSDLELLMMDKTNMFDNKKEDEDKKETKKMSMRQRMLKKKKMKQERKGQHSVTTPVTDPRFTKMYTHEDFFLQQQTT